MEM
ncbi:Protein of unknown function [Bacillus cereus]|jgi:hypothetical protein